MCAHTLCQPIFMGCVRACVGPGGTGEGRGDKEDEGRRRGTESAKAGARSAPGSSQLPQARRSLHTRAALAPRLELATRGQGKDTGERHWGK